MGEMSHVFRQIRMDVHDVHSVGGTRCLRAPHFSSICMFGGEADVHDNDVAR